MFKTKIIFLTCEKQKIKKIFNTQLYSQFYYIYLLFLVAQKPVSFHRLSTTKKMVVPRPSYIPCSNFQTAIGFIFSVTFWFAKVGTIIMRKYLNFTKKDQIFFSVNIKKKDHFIHFFREMCKKKINLDSNQVHFQCDILVCTGT